MRSRVRAHALVENPSFRVTDSLFEASRDARDGGGGNERFAKGIGDDVVSFVVS